MAAWCNKSLLYHGGGREITNPSINKVRCNKSLPYHRGGRCRQGWAALWSTSWAGRTRSGCPAIKTKLFTIGLKWNILNSRIACLHGWKIYLTSKQDKIWKLWRERKKNKPSTRRQFLCNPKICYNLSETFWTEVVWLGICEDGIYWPKYHLKIIYSKTTCP